MLRQLDVKDPSGLSESLQKVVGKGTGKVNLKALLFLLDRVHSKSEEVKEL